jgi:hypothetical protein
MRTKKNPSGHERVCSGLFALSLADIVGSGELKLPCHLKCREIFLSIRKMLASYLLELFIVLHHDA